MSLLENIYDKSPIFFQNIMVSVSGYQRNKTRYGKEYYKYMKFLSVFDKWSIEKQINYQEKTLVDFINYAYNNSSFYREFYKGIDINSIKKASDLKKLPILTKEILRENIDTISTITEKKTVIRHTGGTTGKSLSVLFKPEDMMRVMAMLDHFKKRLGFIHRKMKRATFNGKHIIPPKQKQKIFWRYNSACKQMIYSSFNLSEENIKYYVESLNEYKPDAIDGFFMSICDIANYIDRHKIKINFNPVAIFPTSETITESGRELIESVFKCKVYDQYASSEGAPFITECKERKLHLELASGVFEKYREDSNEVLVTGFYTHGTPLIRYKIGDSVIFSEFKEKCKCGLESPLVNKIEGRKLDFLYTSEYAKINSGNIANLFKNIPNVIIKSQVVQEKIGEIIIYIKIDKDDYKKKYDDLIRDEFIHKFGEGTNVVIKHVEEIKREKSGKYTLIKNNITI